MRHRPLELQSLSNGGPAKPRRRGMMRPMLKSLDSNRGKRCLHCLHSTMKF